MLILAYNTQTTKKKKTQKFGELGSEEKPEEISHSPAEEQGLEWCDIFKKGKIYPLLLDEEMKKRGK